MERFILTLEGKRVVLDWEDGMIWKESEDGKFSIKDFNGTVERRHSVRFLSTIVWSLCVPIKVGFFDWEAS